MYVPLHATTYVCVSLFRKGYVCQYYFKMQGVLFTKTRVLVLSRLLGDHTEC